MADQAPELEINVVDQDFNGHYFRLFHLFFGQLCDPPPGSAKPSQPSITTSVREKLLADSRSQAALNLAVPATSTTTTSTTSTSSSSSSTVY
jgi:hypothetical protein